MARENGNTTDALSLTAKLQDAPYRFEFFEALRLLECMHRDKPRTGESLRPCDDPVRFAQEPSMAFAPSTLASYEPGEGEIPPRLSVNFLGLFGPNGPLPLHLTEYARDRLRNAGDPTFSRFADLFHHRMISLFYRAWASARPTVHFDRPETDRFALYLGSLQGLGLPSLRDRDALPDRAKLHHTGRFSGQTRHAEGLREILYDHFGLPVEIEEFIGEWLELPDDCRLRLGESPESGTLGTTATLGARIWDASHKFRIRMGPISLEDYERFLPAGDRHGLICSLVRSYVGIELAWDLQLTLEAAAIPPPRLGNIRLGWTSWLGEEPHYGDADDLILEPRTGGPGRETSEVQESHS